MKRAGGPTLLSFSTCGRDSALMFIAVTRKRKSYHGSTLITPGDFLTVSIVLAVVTLGASYIPARTATKVDPMMALRYE
jgi:ABC-type antimicrobial peptide transport system permease subunit